MNQTNNTQTVVLIVLGVLVGLPILACGGCLGLGLFMGATIEPPPIDTPAPAQAPETPVEDATQNAPAYGGETYSGPSGVTLAQYDRIENGQTYEATVAMLGQPAQQLSETTVGETTAAVYQWDGTALGANALITFTNGRVSAKAQFGLQ